MEKKTKVISIRLDEPDYFFIRSIAKNHNTTLSKIIKDAISIYATSEKQETKKAISLIDTLEKIAMQLQQNQNNLEASEETKNIFLLCLSIYNFLREYANSTLLVADKRNKFISQIDNFEKDKFGITMPEKFF